MAGGTCLSCPLFSLLLCRKFSIWLLRAHDRPMQSWQKHVCIYSEVSPIAVNGSYSLLNDCGLWNIKENEQLDFHGCECLWMSTVIAKLVTAVFLLTPPHPKQCLSFCGSPTPFSCCSAARNILGSHVYIRCLVAQPSGTSRHRHDCAECPCQLISRKMVWHFHRTLSTTHMGEGYLRTSYPAQRQGLEAPDVDKLSFVPKQWLGKLGSASSHRVFVVLCSSLAS